MLHGRTLKDLARRYPALSQRALSYRFQQAMRQYVAQPRKLNLPGPLVLLVDGLYFRFKGQPWVLYLMALKPCNRARAWFLDPVLFPGREEISLWSEAIDTIPINVYKRIRAMVSDQIRGMPSLAVRKGWILQLCHFHLISQLQGSRGRRKRNLAGRTVREALYQLTRQALELPDGPRLKFVLRRLKKLVQQPMGSRVMRMVVREFLRRTDPFRAYRRHPKLDLPTTTGTVEAMGRIVRDLMRQTRSIRSPHALQLWATALIRMHPSVRCNGKHFQPKKFL
ncbi:MAG: hypothetical protein GTO40_15035 [Deltaproteobacteria bacterium]|nr:hypothetical protein [Deltaproteobacteria bacterium]